MDLMGHFRGQLLVLTISCVSSLSAGAGSSVSDTSTSEHGYFTNELGTSHLSTAVYRETTEVDTDVVASTVFLSYDDDNTALYIGVGVTAGIIVIAVTVSLIVYFCVWKPKQSKKDRQKSLALEDLINVVRTDKAATESKTTEKLSEHKTRRSNIYENITFEGAT